MTQIVFWDTKKSQIPEFNWKLIRSQWCKMRRLLSDFQTLCSSLPKSDYIKIRFYYRNTPICKCENQDLKRMKKESRHKNSFTKVICITLTALIHLCFSSTIFVAINVKSSKSWWFNWSGFPVCSYICARRVIKGEGGHTEHHLIFYMNVQNQLSSLRSARAIAYWEKRGELARRPQL